MSDVSKIAMVRAMALGATVLRCVDGHSVGDWSAGGYRVGVSCVEGEFFGRCGVWSCRVGICYVEDCCGESCGVGGTVLAAVLRTAVSRAMVSGAMLLGAVASVSTFF